MITESFYSMLNEIKEQPELLRALFEKREEITKPFVDLVSKNRTKRVYFTGSGSPIMVSKALVYAAKTLLGVEATACPAMIFNNHDHFDTDHYRPEEMLLICPSESGMGKGQVNAERTAKKLGIPVVCTTWNMDGILARECDVVLAKIPPQEVALATTKGHSMALLLLLMCFVDTAKALGRLNEEEYQSYMDAFAALPDTVTNAINSTLKWFNDYGDRVMGCQLYRFIAYGSNVGTIEEAALKFVECNKRPALFYELEECMHGPIRSIRKDDVVFLILAEEGKEKERMLLLYDVIKTVTDNCFLIQNSDDSFIDPDGLHFKCGNKEFVNTIEFLVPLQILSFKIAEGLGLDTTIRTSLALKQRLNTSYKNGE